MGYKKGVVHLLPVIIIVVIVAAAWLVVAKFILKGKLPFFDKKEPTKVELKTEYQNPFNKKTQFVNPFDQTKNPFAVAK